MIHRLREYFAAIGRTVLTLGDGLAVTCSYLLRRPVTLQYPDRIAQPLPVTLPARSRGLLEMDPELCTGCAMCDKTCPIECIEVVTAKDAAGARQLTRLDIDVGKCMFCGLCVEVCPTGAIRHSHEFEGTMARLDDLVLHFVSAPRPPAKPPKKGEPVVFKPLGSIVRRALPSPWGLNRGGKP
jgi:formate hydrogenlyase subunit 6/NADH:ubiquinone oxidoreductase subunit I